MKGLVIKNTGSWYQVKSDDGQFIECKIKGNFRLKGIRSTNPVAVGDRVQIILNQEGTAFINEIEDRKNYIIRRSSNLSKQSHILAANLDQCMLVVTVNYPETRICRSLSGSCQFGIQQNRCLRWRWVPIFGRTNQSIHTYRLSLLQSFRQKRSWSRSNQKGTGR